MKKLTKKKIKETIESGFYQLENFDVKNSVNCMQRALAHELKNEKSHREYAPSGTRFKTSALLCARYFVMKYIVEQLEEPTQSITAILDYRLSFCFAQALVHKYREEIEDVLTGFDFEKFKQISYPEDLI